MKKLFLFVPVGIIALLSIIASSRTEIEVSQAEIAGYSRDIIPNQKPLQTDCCYPNDKTGTTVGHGGRCTTGSQSCVTNGCPSGTSECGGTSGQ